MTIRGCGTTTISVLIDAPGDAHDFVAVHSVASDGRTVRIFLDLNHAEALETAIRAARLEAQARAVAL